MGNDAELNDTPATALALTVGTPVVGHLGYSRSAYADVDNVDYYKFTVPVDGDVTFTTTTNSTLYSLTTVYDSNGTSLINSAYTGYGGVNSVTIGHLAPGTTYYVAVSRYSQWGTYQLTTSEASPTDANDVENNDIYSKALKLTNNVTSTGHLGYSRTAYGDRDTTDFYKFSAGANGDMNFSLTNSSNLYALVSIIDHNHTSVIYSFYVGYGATGSSTIPHFGSSTTYYVSVTLYAGYGSYQLKRVFTKQAIKGDTETNDVYLKALLFAPNTTKTGNLGYSRASYGAVDSSDFYKITVTQAGTLTINLTNTSTLYDLVTIYNTNGTSSMGSFYVGYGAAGNGSVSLPAAGTYYVGVSLYAQWGGYTLKNTFQ